MARQGEVYWLEEPEPHGSEPGWIRPAIVIQNDLLNESNLNTTLLVTLTSNLRRALAIGNVRVPAGESGLPADSVAVVSQLVTRDHRFLGDPVGRIPRTRVRQIVRGVTRILEPADP